MMISGRIRSVTFTQQEGIGHPLAKLTASSGWKVETNVNDMQDPVVDKKALVQS
jgi:hypothetical protein